MINANLPIFVGGYNAGDQLKWIARGIYGVKPPVLVSGKQSVFGPYNAVLFNQLPFNGERWLISQSRLSFQMICLSAS
jgi:hypothetical protein